MFQLLQYFYLSPTVAGQDYNNVSTILTFTGQSVESISVPIIDDEVFELEEVFYGRLVAVGSLPSNVQLKPERAAASIIDNKGK